MKKFLQFSGIIAAVLAIVAFILFMATPGAMSGNDIVAKGTTMLFGKKEAVTVVGINLGTAETKLAWSALLAWIFVLVALIILLLGIILPLLKVKALEKFAGILNLVAVVLLVVAGIFAFVSLAVFCSANGLDSVPEKWSLGAGWVIAGILAIAAGAIAILPAVMDLIGKKK